MFMERRLVLSWETTVSATLSLNCCRLGGSKVSLKGILSPPPQLHKQTLGLGSSTQNRTRFIPYRLVRAPLSQL